MVNMDAAQQLIDTQQAAAHILAKNDWQLLSYPDLGVDPDTFARRVLTTAQTWHRTEGTAVLDDRYLTRATQHEYAKLLYTACGRKDTPAGQRAYQELWNRYSRIVRFKMADHADAQDVTQNGMKKIYEKLAQCHKPGSFLGWAYRIMLNEMRQYWRKQGRQPPIIGWGSASQESDDTTESLLSEERLDATQLSILQTMRSLIQPSPEEEAAEHETDQTLRELIRRCLQHETRSLVFQRLVLNGAEVSHLAVLLDRTPNAIHMLRHHALKKLRQCPELLAMLQAQLASPIGGAA
jgi:RNA polymerase sigma factor (sigma-70 family)